jgi:flagellar motility protein MotE (MotC chaperone)
MARSPARGAIGGVSLIVFCFLGSAALRIGEHGHAIAQEIGSLANQEAAPTPIAAPAPADAEGLLAAIRERESQLEAESTRLAERAQTLEVAEAKLAEQLAAFEVAQRGLEETLALADSAAERDIARMTTVYEAMKPADAAKIVEKMELNFAAGLVVRMRPELAAQVLTGMDPERAYAITVMVASRNAAAPRE